MSQKTEKAIRKLAKQELEKRMVQNQQAPQPPAGLQVITSLENFIQLYTVLTGEKPKSITLTDIMYNSYVQESQRHAEVLGLKPGFKDEIPVFNGVKLEKKSPIIVPEGTPSSTPTVS